MFQNIFLSSLNSFFLFYTDPGSGQLILQLIMATLLGGLFYFRKLKDLIFRRSSASKDSSIKLKSTKDLETIGK